jgi:glycosyltransferase involved in cell wall biosynthesis
MKASNTRILFFVTEDWFVCSHWLPIIIGAKGEGYDVVVVTRTNRHAGIIEKHGARVIPFGISRRGSNVFREIAAIRRLTGIYHAEKPDIVHHVAMKPMLYGSLAAHLLRIPHTFNWVAGMGWLFVSNERQAKVLQAVVRKVLGMLLRGTSVIVENMDDREIIAGLGVEAGHIKLVRGAGVDTEMYAPSPQPEGVPLVVLPARMLWDKGVGEFVDAARQLRQRGVQARFALVGEPDPENPASVPEEQLLAWRQEGAVEWWGRSEDMPQVYAQSRIVCLPSYREGLPKSLLEAASCARPVVATNVPGCRDIVRDGDNGILVEARNAAALADALARLLANPKLCGQMGQRGRERVLQEFSQERIVSQVLSLYREVLS